MLATCFILVAAVATGVLGIKYLTGKGKPSEKRSALENISVSLFTIWRKNTEDVARSVRTASVIKTEALQEVNDALASLNESYISNMINLKSTRKRLIERTLPELRNKPKVLEEKAREAKAKYEKSVEAGNPIDAHKQTAYKYLGYIKELKSNIEKSEKTLEKLNVTIETEEANYKGRRVDLEMMKVNLECMVEIPQLELNNSLNKIRSLKTEIEDRINEDSIRSEVEREMRGDSVNHVNMTDAELEDEFNRL